jgi:diapolycopene oxygenase
MKDTHTSNVRRVVVIGAGLGGMTAAIQLARAGFQVDLLEKNGNVGGKLNILREAGFTFDLGPSIFTLPQIFRPIFEGDGKRLEDYITLQRVDPQWRNFFEDGRVIDLWEDPARMREELNKLGPEAIDDYKRFLEYSRTQYAIVERGYFAQGLDTFWQFVRFYGLKDARGLDYMGTMAGGIAKRVRDPYRQVCRLFRLRRSRIYESHAKHSARVWSMVCLRRALRTCTRL